MKKNHIDRPLGKILHIVDGEAITHPNQSFVARNAKVVLDSLEEIGVLGDPFGADDRPFQPIILKNPERTDIIGKLAFAQVRGGKSQDQKKKRGSRSSKSKRARDL